mmetsp:Transcript_11747/g.31733  ORF Transcript_11747/g.31733 Transcript_11747/m.31733 type:complete len:182 (-) Transcript_11747:137-682(-)
MPHEWTVEGWRKLPSQLDIYNGTHARHKKAPPASMSLPSSRTPQEEDVADFCGRAGITYRSKGERQRATTAPKDRLTVSFVGAYAMGTRHHLPDRPPIGYVPAAVPDSWPSTMPSEAPSPLKGRSSSTGALSSRCSSAPGSARLPNYPLGVPSKRPFLIHNPYRERTQLTQFKIGRMDYPS